MSKKEFPKSSCVCWIKKYGSDVFELAYFDVDRHGGDFRIVGNEYSTAADLVEEWREFIYPAWASAAKPPTSAGTGTGPNDSI